MNVAGTAGVEAGRAGDDACANRPVAGAVRVEASPRGIAVVFRDPGGNAEQRELSTTDIAATWIESRLRSDVSRPLLAARMTETTSAPAPTLRTNGAPGAGPRATPHRDAPPLADAAASRPGRLQVAAFGEVGSDDRNSAWRGIGASACVRTGPLCVGGVGRIGRANRDDTVERSGYEVLASVAVPVRAGRATISPDIAVGIGQVTTEEPAFVAPAPGCPDDSTAPECGAPWARFQTVSGRAAAGVTASLPIADRVFIDLRVEGSFAFGARTDDFLVDDPFTLPMPDPGPDGEPGDDGRVVYRIDGEPSRVVRASIGLRLGVW